MNICDDLSESDHSEARKYLFGYPWLDYPYPTLLADEKQVDSKCRRNLKLDKGDINHPLNDDCVENRFSTLCWAQGRILCDET